MAFPQLETQAQHTPGPWFAESWEDFPHHSVATDTTSTRCLVLIDKVDEQDEANTHLICASPDLLAALENITAKIVSGKTNLASDIDLCLQAIGKAKGLA